MVYYPPKRCISITSASWQELIHLLEAMLSDTPEFDLIEWRLDAIDAFQEYFDPYLAEFYLALLAFMLPNQEILITLRTKKEGGLFKGNSQNYINYIKFVIHQQQTVQYIDLEYYYIKAHQRLSYIESLLRFFHTTQLIWSWHHGHMLRKTHIQKFLTQPLIHKASFVKIVCTPKTEEDVLQLFNYRSYLSNEHPSINVILFGMGTLSKVTRFNYGMSHMPITYCYFDKPSARGQLSIEEINQLIDIFY